MAKEKFTQGLMVGILVTAAVIYFIYINRKLENLRNELIVLKKPIDSDNENISSVEALPSSIRNKFISSIQDRDRNRQTSQSFPEALSRIYRLKKVIENRDGYRFFKNKEIKNEKDLHFLYDLTWADNYDLDVNKEVNNGRGPVDFKISYGFDQTIVEFKLASNSKLKSNLANQLEIYASANDTPIKIAVIFYFTDSESRKLMKVLKELELEDKENIITIDCRDINKPSASKVS